MVDAIYEMTVSFPKEELFGLTSQIRRAAVSVPSNIAEGSARNHTKEFLQFLFIARGSLAELQTQIEIAKRRSYMPEEKLLHVLNHVHRVGKMKARLIQSLQS